MTPPSTFPPALAHGPLEELFPGVFFVTGTIAMNGLLRFSRNMTVLRDRERLVLINSVRLTEDGLTSLDALGKVTDVVRIAGFHGADDAFYKERYGATVSVLRGHKYKKGFSPKAPEYFTADRELGAGEALPIEGATLFVYDSKPKEGLVLLPRDGGILIAGDSLQNWHTTDQYFSLLARPMMRMMGFIKRCNVGPGWLKQAKPPAADLERVLTLDFEHVLPAHGAPVRGGAKKAFQPAIKAALAQLAAAR